MANQTSSQSKMPLWLDCDPGHDDAFAILFAAYQPCLQLLGISTVYGNASLTKTTNNALSVLEAIGKSNVPVYPGSSRPFCRVVGTAPDIHGESGLDGTNLLPKPSKSALYHCNAICEMRDALRACPPNTSWIVATGALTNIALLLQPFPDVAQHIKGLSIMGGAVGNGFTSVSMGPDFMNSEGKPQSRIGNKTPYAEFNIYCDPEAAQSIMQNPTLQPKIFLIPLDLTHQAYANVEVQNILLQGSRGVTRLRKMFNELLMFFAHTYKEVFGLSHGPPLHDPLAVAILLWAEDVAQKITFHDGEGERWIVDVVLEGEQIGRTRLKKSEHGLVVPRSLDLDHFWKEIDNCMARADEATAFI